MVCESWSGAVDRLRAEGRWAEADQYRDEARRRLRAEGRTRREANVAAWAEMLAAFPPLTPAEPAPKPVAVMQQAAAVAATGRMCDCGHLWIRDHEGDSLAEIAMQELVWWRDKFGIALPADAGQSLIGIIVAMCRRLGQLQEPSDMGPPVPDDARWYLYK